MLTHNIKRMTVSSLWHKHIAFQFSVQSLPPLWWYDHHNLTAMAQRYSRPCSNSEENRYVDIITNKSCIIKVKVNRNHLCEITDLNRGRDSSVRYDWSLDECQLTERLDGWLFQNGSIHENVAWIWKCGKWSVWQWMENVEILERNKTSKTWGRRQGPVQ